MKKALIVILFIIITIIIIILSSLIYKKVTQFEKSKENISIIQSSLEEAVYQKFMGDDIIAGKNLINDYTIEKVIDQEWNIQDKMRSVKTTKIEEGYYDSSLVWILTLGVQSGDSEEWKLMSELPDGFKINISSKQLNELYFNSLIEIAKLKEYGDLAIANGDTNTMRRISAKLLVQQYWLENLSNSSDLSLINKVFSQEDFSKKLGDRNPCITRWGKSTCLDKTYNFTQGVYRSTRNYSVGEPSAQTEWQNAWNQEDAVTQIIGEPTGGVGITTGEDGKNVSPSLNLFYKECKGKGGIVGDTGGVKDRLPTTEGGYTCWYANKNCWDYLTYSGERYMGGNGSCPEEGLLPKPTVPFYVSIYEFIEGIFIPTPSADSWDGTYNLVVTNSSCNVPGFSSSYFSPISETLKVKNDKIDYGYETVLIDENGNANSSFNYNIENTNISYNDNLIFTRNEQGVVTVSGKYNLTASSSEYGVTINVSCTADVTGTRE